MKTLEEFVYEKLKETGIEIGVWSHSILGYSCYVDTTKHDERVRAEAITEFAKAVKEFINTYRYGNDDLVAFIEEYKERENK